jgi:RNA polymerase primary sigma factor
LDREPNYEEIAKDLNITPGRVKENEEFFKLFKLYSLDRLILVEEGRDSGRMEELINLEEGTESSVEKEVAKEDLKQNLNQILNEFLSPRQVEIIKMRFGLEPYFEPHTFQQIGRKFGITKQGAQIIFKKALKKLRHPTRIKKLKSLKVYLT